MKVVNKLLSCTLSLTLCLVNADAYAFFEPKSNNKSAQQTLPSVLKADHVTGDKRKNSLTAKGNVEVAKGSSIVYANEVIYDKNNATFHAIGNVKVQNIEIGKVWATQGTIKEDFSQGDFSDTLLVLNDGSYLKSPKITRESPLITHLATSIFSTCPNSEISENNQLAGKKRDLLSIKSKNVTIDRDEEVFKIRGGVLRLYNVPFFYIPYLKAPLPTSERKSGLLTPSYRNNTRFGLGFRFPYYIALAPNKELTVAPSFYPNSGQILLENNFHHLTSYGEYQLNLELANNQVAQSSNVINATQSKKDYRWNLKGQGVFDFTLNTGLNFDIDDTSDSGYMRDYHNDFRAYTQSTATLDYIKGRTYYGIRGIKFREFEESENLQNVESDQIIIPQINTHIESKPIFFKEKYALTTNTTILSRESGLQYRRMTFIPEINIPISYGGNLFNVNAKVQSDLYSLENNFKYATANNDYDKNQINYQPEFSVNWRLPLYKKNKSNTIMIEPMANFVSSSFKKNFHDIPNEDSNDNELTISNLFVNDRISGYDRNEVGKRVSYGAKSSIFVDKSEYSLIVGQSYRTNDKTQDVTIRGFNDNNKSNIVGMLSYQNADLFRLSYSFHLDESNYRNEINEVTTSFNGERFDVSANYLFLRRNHQNETKRQQLNTTAVFKFNKKYSTKLSLSRNMITGRNLSRAIGFYYTGCCTVFGFSITENNPANLVTAQRSFSLNLSFKNL